MVEAAPRVELGITILQTVALATWLCRLESILAGKNMLENRIDVNPDPKTSSSQEHQKPKTSGEHPAGSSPIELERATRLELATATLAR